MPEPAVSNELLTLAIEIERKGRQFYSSVAGQAHEGEVRAKFRYLSDQEKKHEAAFNDMLQRLSKLEHQAYAPADAGDEYRYIKDVAASTLFAGDKLQAVLGKKSLTDVEAIELGISLEKDSILFYSDMGGMLPRDEQSIIDAITSEEKKHLSELNYVKAKLIKG